MWPILKREVKNYIKNPLFWLGIAIGVLIVFLNVNPYLKIRYWVEGETIVNDEPDAYGDRDVFNGYVPTEEELRREMWEERIQETLISVFGMDNEEAQAVIDEMKEMDVMAACAHLEKYGFYNAYYDYNDTSIRKGSPEEINSYIAGKLENNAFSYYFSRKFADFAGVFMGFFATILLSALFMQDTRKNTYELLHTKPVSAGSYLSGKVGGGFAVCLITLAVLNLIFFGICLIATRNSGFEMEVHLTDFLLASVIYVLPCVLMIVSVYSLISLVFKSPLPAVPLLFLYITYSNMGSSNGEGIFGYYGRLLAIMVRFPGKFFDTDPPPMILLNQCFLIFAAVCIFFVSMQIWKRRRV